MKQFLAIDIGGSKSKFVVFDSELNEIHSRETTGVGLAYDSDERIPVFTQTLSEIKNNYEISSIAVNLGGKNKNQIAMSIIDCFGEIPYGIYRESEGNASIAFGEMYGADIVLLAGTGTIVTGYDRKSKTAICGGWGMNIGDQGSGYDIGLEAIKNSLLALDSGDELSSMQKEITGRDDVIKAESNVGLICDMRDSVRSLIFPTERRKIASYAAVVASHCKSGDENALSIMKNAGNQMGELTIRCIRKLAPYVPCKVAVSGGLCNSSQWWKESFENCICQKYNITEFVYDKNGVMKGTMKLAVDLYDKN